MIWLKNIQAHTLAVESITVRWDVVDTVRPLDGYTISVWRSEAAGGEFAQVSGEIAADAYDVFVDTSVNRLTMRRQHIYRLRVRETSTGNTLFFGSTDPKQVIEGGADPGGVALESAPDLMAAEVLRRFDLRAREYTGTRALLLRRRSTGQYCPACFEVETMRSLDGNCRSCWGTQRAGGYYRAQEFWPVEMSPREDQPVLTRMFELEQQDVVAQVSARYRISPRDLVIYVTGERWRVLKTTSNHRAGAGIWHLAHLRRITPSDIEHQIPISWDADAFDAVPLRQHVRATDIESYRQALQDKGRVHREPGDAGFPTTPLSESG